MVCKGKPLSGNSWAVSNRMKRDLAIRALDMAVALRQPPKDCIYYPAGDYKVICREGIIRIAGRSIVPTRIKSI
jgi:transposase InsO family protein